VSDHDDEEGAPDEELAADELQPVDGPLATADLPGVGGAMRDIEDFQVEEIPAYLPCGEGDHCFAFIEKRGLTTPQAIGRICGALGLRAGDVGYAGLKDKAGITRQWISVQGERLRPPDLRALRLPDVQILEARLHRNKLRTGHLRGNRFTVTLHDVVAGGAERAAAIMARLASDGLPNYYGEQRFGRRGDNAEIGLRALRGEARLPSDRFRHRLVISALQSHLFNAVLAARLEPGGPGLARLLGGEVLQRLDSGGLFVSEDRDTDGARLTRGELVITGPICGPRMVWPKEGSPARALEERELARVGVRPESFAVFGRLARGGRRPLSVRVEQAAMEPLESGALRLRFVLPAGAYASVLLREVSKDAGAAR
jgi:tRNA pseudouridine13 synthase